MPTSTLTLIALGAALAVVILDHILAAIPADRFPPNSTLQLVLHVLRAVFSGVADFIRRPPTAPTALLVVVLLCLPARVLADEPAAAPAPTLAPTRGPLVLPPAAPGLAEEAAAAAVAPLPKCSPDPKPVPAWANYIGWALAAATEITALTVSLYQRAP